MQLLRVYMEYTVANFFIILITYGSKSILAISSLEKTSYRNTRLPNEMVNVLKRLEKEPLLLT